jgi:hypothetical protein
MISSRAAHPPRTIKSVACGAWVETETETEIGVKASASSTYVYVFTSSFSLTTKSIAFTNADQHSDLTRVLVVR